MAIDYLIWAVLLQDCEELALKSKDVGRAAALVE
jgi:hypothetical protein